MTELREKGCSLNAICRELGLAFRTVYRFAHASGVDELLVARARSRKIDRFTPYLHQRWNAGVTDATVLHAELAALSGKDQLPGWLEAVSVDELPALRSLANSLRRDQDAVTNGLSLPYSSGQVEGTVNRIKMIKRQMFGRAKFDLLRKRVLLAR